MKAKKGDKMVPEQLYPGLPEEVNVKPFWRVAPLTQAPSISRKLTKRWGGKLSDTQGNKSL